MKAAVCRKYGSTRALQLEEVECPTPRDDEVLVRVHAASMNDFDWGMVCGRPLVLRFFNGFFKPKIQIVGCDIAGRVEAVGSRVTRFTPGDDVFGDLCQSRFGGFAEYVAAPETALLKMPATMSYEQAASLPQAASLAMQGLFDYRPLTDGQKILFNGAGGGVGTLGLQIARQWDVEVTCVDSADKLDMLRELGADHVIDYRREDFTRQGRRYDLIIDAKTFRSPSAYARALERDGIYATVGGSMWRMVQILAAAPIIRRVRHRNLHIVSLQANRHLEYAIELFEAGKLKPVIDSTYDLDQVSEAMKYYLDAGHKGKVMIRVAQDVAMPA